jgi:serine/threonine-protein kinase
MFKIVLDAVPPPQSIVPDLDPAFASIVSKAMARDLTQRFQSTAEVIDALEAWSQSGKSVALPTGIQASAQGHLPAGARGSMASISDVSMPVAGQKTAGTWATSQPGATPVAPKKSGSPALAAALGIGVLLLGGGAFAAYALHDKSLPAVSSAAAVNSAAQPLPAALPSAPREARVIPSALEPTAVPAPALSAAPVLSAVPAPSAAPVPSVAPVRPAAHAAPVRAAAKPAAKPVRASTTKPGTPEFGY